MSYVWLLFTLIFAALLTLAQGQCDGSAALVTGSVATGIIFSPNWNNEYGKSANCTWMFTPPSDGKEYALRLRVELLTLLVWKDGERHCLGSYNLTMNNEKVDCARYVLSSPAGTTAENPFCNAYYSSPICANVGEIQECEIRKQTSFPVPMTYFSDGRTSAEVTAANMYFWIRYEFMRCPNATSMTTTNITTMPAIKKTMFTTSSTSMTPTGVTNNPETSTSTETNQSPTPINLETTMERNTNATTSMATTTKQSTTTTSTPTSTGTMVKTPKPTAKPISPVAAASSTSFLRESTYLPHTTKGNMDKTVGTENTSTAVGTEGRQNMTIIIAAAVGGGVIVTVGIVVIVFIFKRKQNAAFNGEIALEENYCHDEPNENENPAGSPEEPNSSTTDSPIL